jgi:hypothetical protein
VSGSNLAGGSRICAVIHSGRFALDSCGLHPGSSLRGLPEHSWKETFKAATPLAGTPFGRTVMRTYQDCYSYTIGMSKVLRIQFRERVMTAFAAELFALRGGCGSRGIYALPLAIALRPARKHPRASCAEKVRNACGGLFLRLRLRHSGCTCHTFGSNALAGFTNRRAHR